MKADKVVLITGGSSGIGLAVSEYMRDAGCSVYEVSRRPSCRDAITHITGDVTVPEDMERAVQTVVERENRIDILINCAGSGISGAVEFTDAVNASSQMAVIFDGTSNACRAVLPVMRRQKSGRIVNISSVAAVVPIPFQTYYSAAKAAVNSFTLALANEVRPFNISVCAVMPGDIRTGFTSARKKITAGNEEYDGRIEKSVSRMENDEKNGMSPTAASRFIAKTALSGHVKPLYSIRFDYKLITVLAKILPCRFMNFVISKLYG